MTTLLVCESREGRIHPAVARVMTAARQLGQPVHVLVAASPAEPAVAELACLPGVARVRCIGAAHYRDQLAENLAMLIAQMASAYRYILFPATPFGKGLAPRLAAMLDVAPISDVTEILGPDLFVRPMYAGDVWAKLRCREPVCVMTVRPSAFKPADGVQAPAPIDDAPAGPDMGVSRLLGRQFETHGRPVLSTARCVVAGGRGLGSKANFDRLILPLAERLGAAVGATRAAVDAGFAPHDWQIGQTGQIVAPELYIAVGLSGAPQHLAGMRAAGLIVAIDRDPEAPIVKLADYRLLGDLNELVPAVIAGLGRC